MKMNYTNENKYVFINYLKSIYQICFIYVILLKASSVNGLLLDSSANVGGAGVGSAVSSGTIYLDKNGNLEQSIAAVFNKVAYGSTTTKRSIPDNVYVSSLTTVPTPLLTTYRYREKESSSHQLSLNNNEKFSHNRNYEVDLERDHVLPTSAPNADILKSNSNPTYPNPNRHHSHDRERHRHLQNSTPVPSGHNLKKNPTMPMFPGDMPSYSPPARSFFTPPLPPEYQNPFADKPTLRGTNSDSSIVNVGTFSNRRPIPPPSLMPGHERIPFRPPDLVSTKNTNTGLAPPDQPSITLTNLDSQRKKALNTPSYKQSPNNNYNTSNNKDVQINSKPDNSSDALPKSNGLHFPSISRILSGSNGRKEDIPEVLLRTVTVRPSSQPSPVLNSLNNFNSEAVNNNQHDDYDQFNNRNRNMEGNNNNNNNNDNTNNGHNNLNDDENNNSDNDEEDDDDDEDDIIRPVEDIVEDFNFHKNLEEPKTQPKIKSEHSNIDIGIYSTQVIHKTDSSQFTTTQSLLDHQNRNNEWNMNRGGGGSVTTSVGTDGYRHTTSPSSKMPTWSIAWNIHVYLSAILFTVLAVYSIFKMIFYDKLTHLFNQSYFICTHLLLIIICLSRIFYLCYDAYNIHSSFNNFLSEILLNIPSTLLTVTFSILVLFLLIKSLNNKNNRYSALMRPMTIVIGCSVHICLCITLHYVENKQNQLIYNRRSHFTNFSNNNNNNNNTYHPPRVLSLICQIIYIFICLSLGFLYLYLYRILKRVLRNKSQNYIHGYQNLSYAIHITIATALLFILLASLQIYGAVSISTIRPLISNLNSDIDWLQWGYQFSLRLIEIAIITLLSWVTGLKTGASKVMQREKEAENHNVSGFALFPCTSSSSQEHFETDYPAVCNANTNLHTYTLRTGKPLYDDNFALNSLGSVPPPNNPNQNIQPPGYGLENNAINSDFARQYETNSTRSSLHNSDRDRAQQSSSTLHNPQNDDCLNDSGTIPDHYENPNFELHPGGGGGVVAGALGCNNNNLNKNDVILDSCYSEPINNVNINNNNSNNNTNNNINNNNINNNNNNSNSNNSIQPTSYDFQSFERPNFDRSSSRNEFRASKNLKAMKNNTANNFERGLYENPDRRSTNSNNSYTSNKNFNNFNNSFERQRGDRNNGSHRGGVIRKSGTLSNIGGVHSSRNPNQNQLINANRASGVHTLSSSRTPQEHNSNKNLVNGQKTQCNNNKKDRPWTNESQNFVNVDDCILNYDNSSNSGGSSGSRPSYHPSQDRIHYNQKQLTLDTRGTLLHDQLSDTQQCSSSESATSGSMLVAEHGFVRFRALDDIGLSQASNQQITSLRNSGRRDLNTNNMHSVINSSINDKRFKNT